MERRSGHDRIPAEHLLDCVWRMDLDLRITYVSPAAEAMLGIPAEVLVDSRLADHTTAEDHARLRELQPQAGVIMMTGQHDLELAIEAIKSGAADFVHKPLQTASLQATVDKVLAGHAEEPEHRPPVPDRPLGDLIGRRLPSPAQFRRAGQGGRQQREREQLQQDRPHRNHPPRPRPAGTAPGPPRPPEAEASRSPPRART